MESNKLLEKNETENYDQPKAKEPLVTTTNNPNELEDIHGYPTMDLILNKLGYTNYHYILITGCCLFYFSEGAQLYAFNLLMPVYNVILRLNSAQHIIMSSICYFGYAFGSFFVGILTKNFNRKVPLLVSLTIYSISSVLIVLYENLYWILIFRFITGSCIGIISSLYLSHLSEYLPIYFREFSIGIVLSTYILGILFYIYSFKLIIPNYQRLELWRIILLVISVPCIIATIFSIFILRESPRLLLNKDKFVEGVAELRTLTLNTDVVITDIEEENLKKEVAANKVKHIEFSFTLLFNDKFRLLTIVNLFLMVTTSATYVSNFFSLPLILYKERKHHSEMFFEIIVAQSFSIPAILLAALLSGLPTLGRKYSIALGFAVCFAVASFASFFKFGLIVCCSLINFFIMASYFLSKVYLIESFPSKLRDHGMSVIFVVARLGESFSPSICELMFKWYEYGPLLWIALLCLIGMVFSFLIPFETRGQAIDSKI
jgi:MFS family permease